MSGLIKAIRGKLHGIRVTSADLHYHGSITLDPEVCARAGIYPLEYVEIWNKNSGARLSTYVIHGEPGSRCCVLNGAAARTCQKGDELIIAASHWIPADELPDTKPAVLTFMPDNEIDQVLHYEVAGSEQAGFGFSITDEQGDTVRDPVHNYANVDVNPIRDDLRSKGLSEADIQAFISQHLQR